MEQRAVIETNSKQILVVAGPGTGKTHCASAKVVELITKGIVEANEILVLTNSEETAAQVQTIVDINTQMRANSTIIKSIRGFCHLVLEDYRISDSKSEQWLNDELLTKFVETHNSEFNLCKYNPQNHANVKYHDLVDYFSKLQSFGIQPEDYEKHVQIIQNEIKTGQANQGIEKYSLIHNYKLEYAESHKELSQAFSIFYKLKQTKLKFGFADRILMTIDLLKKQSVRTLLLERIKYIIIDQIEDWGLQEWKILEALTFFPDALIRRHLLIFGDDDSAIMSWASGIKNIFKILKEKLPDSVLLPLTINFRNSSQVLQAARNLISHNPGRLEQLSGIKKTMISFDQISSQKSKAPSHDLDDSKPKVYHLEFENQIEEHHGIVALIEELSNSEKYENSKKILENTLPTIAIITHFKNETEYLNKSLYSFGAPINSSLIEKPEIKFLTNIIQLVLEPSSDFALYDLLSSGIFSIPGTWLSQITELHQKSQKSLRQILENKLNEVYALNDLTSKLEQKSLKKAQKLLRLLQLLESKIGQYTMKELIWNILKETKILASHRNPSNSKQESESRNIARFIQISERIEISLQNTRPVYVWAMLKNTINKNNLEHENEQSNLISILSVWSSKNYEYDYVIIPNCNDDNYPGKIKRNEFQQLLQEVTSSGGNEKEYLYLMRRLLYVSITRAKKGVIFTYNKDLTKRKIPRKISRFVPEILGVPNAFYLKKSTYEFSQTDLTTENSDSEFVLEIDKNSIQPQSLSSFLTFLRCPLQYYHSFIINLPQPPTILNIYQEAIASVIASISSKFINSQNLSSYDLSRKVFDSVWEKHDIDPLKNPEMYETGMNLSEELVDSDLESGDCKFDQSWKITIKSEIGTILEFEDFFQRIDQNDVITHYLVYSENICPTKESLNKACSFLAWAFWKTYTKLPSTVLLRYIDSQFQMKSLKFVPTENTINKFDAFLIETCNLLASAKFPSNPKKCKPCPFKKTCPGSQK